MNIEEAISVVNVLKSKENSENINNPKHKYVLLSKSNICSFVLMSKKTK